MAGFKNELAELLTGVGLVLRCTKRERQAIARHAQTGERPAPISSAKVSLATPCS